MKALVEQAFPTVATPDVVSVPRTCLFPALSESKACPTEA